MIDAAPLRRHAATGLLIAAALAALYFLVILFGNRMGFQPTIELLGAARPQRAAGDDISVMIWNLGYAGLGAESDFVVDGGRMYLPPGRKAVEKNMAGVAAELRRAEADVILLQETARPSLLTFGVDVAGAAARALAERDNAFSADFKARFLPPFLGPKNGLFSSVAVDAAARDIAPLPLEPGFLFGLTRRAYHMHVVRIPATNGDWTIVNVHLSAFDDGANVRLQQLRAVLAFAAREHAQGRRVVVGGDWNYEFAPPARPHTTKDVDLFWVHPFPFAELPEGWRTVFDPKTPSVRTNERPYRRGENYTTVIDGFVISPNVEATSVAARDLDFQFSDHHPVVARFRAR